MGDWASPPKLDILQRRTSIVNELDFESSEYQVARFFHPLVAVHLGSCADWFISHVDAC